MSAVAQPFLSNLNEFAARFGACDMKRAEWTHEAHLAVGAWHVDRYGAEEALARLRPGIRALNESFGNRNTAADGYHETITAAYVRLIGEFLGQCAAGLSIEECVSQLLASPLAKRDVLLRYYSEGLLMSARARAAWVEPDLRPLPSTRMPLPSAMLLDLDDTILDDSSTIDECWRDACEAHRADYAGIDPVEMYAAIRKQSEWYWGDPERHRLGRLDLDAARVHVVRLALAQLGVERSGLAEKIGGQYARQRDATMAPLPDAIDTVRWLRARGVRLALVTNGAGSAQQRKIERFDLTGLFDSILVEGAVGFGKPDERIYRKALQDLAVDPEDAWMAGDHLEFDVAAPQRLGLFTVWIDARGRGLPPGTQIRPDRVVRRLSELRAEL